MKKDKLIVINNIFESHLTIGTNIGNVCRELAELQILCRLALCRGFVCLQMGAMSGGQWRPQIKVTREVAESVK